MLVWGLGFGVWVSGLGFGIYVWDVGCSVRGFNESSVLWALAGGLQIEDSGVVRVGVCLRFISLLSFNPTEVH